MEYIDGVFYMNSCEENDPLCIHTAEELAELIHKIGFLPLFSNEIKGFSVEEKTTEEAWWSEDEKRDPWMWRQTLSRRDDLAYGKFFNKKAGFISKKWFPVIANYRRNGYDFEALVGDELASHRAQKIMTALDLDEELRGLELLSNELKEKSGFGTGGEKNFDGVVTELQMQTFLLVSDFRQRKNKKGQGYGWHIAVLTTPETKWGYDYIAEGYTDFPSESWKKIVRQIQKFCPGAQLQDIQKVLGIRQPGTPAVTKKKAKGTAALPYPQNLITALRIPDWNGELSKDQMEGLLYALESLREVERVVIRHRYEDHMTFNDIAEFYKRPEDRIRSIHNRAITKLKKDDRLPYIVYGYTGFQMKAYEEQEEEEAETAKIVAQIEQKSKVDDFSAIRITDLGFSTRISNALKRGGIATVYDLVAVLVVDYERLSRIRNLGEQSQREVLEKLKEMGIEIPAQMK